MTHRLLNHHRTLTELFFETIEACGKVRLANAQTNKSSTVYNVNSYTMAIEANNKNFGISSSHAEVRQTKVLSSSLRDKWKVNGRCQFKGKIIRKRVCVRV